MKVFFVTTDLNFGGAQRITLFLASRFSIYYDCTLVVLGTKNYTSHNIPVGVKVVYLNTSSTIYSVITYINYLSSHKPDVIFSSLPLLNLINLFIRKFLFRQMKIVVRESSIISQLVLFRGIKDKVIYLLFKICYNWADEIIVQSNDMFNDLLVNCRVDRDKLNLIYNPLTIDIVDIVLCSKTDVIRILTISRLSSEKGILRLLDVLALVKRPIEFTLIGRGPLEREVLKSMKSFGKNILISYIPEDRNISKYFSTSDLFLQGSYVEGFPNVVLEANCYGLPVFAFESIGGTRDIIDNGINGMIIKDKLQFALEVEKFDSILWKGDLIKKHVQRKFNNDLSLGHYKMIFDKLLKKVI
jgi:glycosyltransferase involved in cell wall biosynthesis